MSSSDAPSPATLFEQARNMSIADAIRRGFVAWVLAIVLTIASGLQQVFELIFLPFRVLAQLAIAGVTNFLLQPMGLVGEGAAVTSQSISVFGVAALPVSVLIALGTLLIVILYLQLEITSNILPGLIVDNRLVDFLFTSPEEEAQGED